jgi:membrane protease YdiL (CAAX protease family)
MFEKSIETPDPSRTTRLALVFEGGLGLAALIIGWLIGRWPPLGIGPTTGGFSSQLAAIGYGVATTLPLLVALIVIDRAPIAALRRVREITHAAIFQMFGGASVLQLAAVSMAAGWGEELLFRGLVQGTLSRVIPGHFVPGIAIAVASVLFGVCHWLNTTYAILAMLAGVYFGVIYQATDNLLTPMTAHAAYDFLALVYLVRPANLLRSTSATCEHQATTDAPQPMTNDQ